MCNLKKMALLALAFAVTAMAQEKPAAPADSAQVSAGTQSPGVSAQEKPVAAPVDTLPSDTLAVPFSRIYVSIEGGEMYPFGDLVDAVENSFYGGFGFRYSYWPDFDGFVHFNYTYVKVRDKDIPFPGVHEFVGRLGLDWRWKYIRPLAVGAGFTCNWTRADSDDGKDYYSGRGGMLLDNETEFGWFARINMPFMYFREYTAGLNVLWEQIWTLPERSNTLTVGFYIERRIW